ncbi:WXG100 family type VII secretion target [Nocardia altamirensis]|uniref:WXG100 family type VII secretion target n=1 Tax=Nocardia altamirensis TaxID=472158 RepID=UPI0008402FA6|nr:hypothetical protein [Nocardia altamirensis]
MVFTVPAHAPIAEYLDIGSRSLLYFEHFEARYRRAFGDLPAGFASYEQLHRRFYEQNGLNEDKLASASARLREVLQEAGTQLDSQRGSAQALPALWQGQAADAAIDMLNQQVGRADTDWQAAGTASQALAGAVPALRSAVKIKADVVRYILENGETVRIDGKAPEDIDDIISGKTIGFTSTMGNTLLKKLWRIFPELAEDDGAVTRGYLIPGTDYTHRIQQRCRDWLDQVFKPDYAAKVQKFIEACDVTDQGVKNVYTPLIGALNQVSDAAYPRPAGAPVPGKSTEGTQPTETNAPGPSGNPTAPTVPVSPTPAVPASTTPTVPASTTPTIPASTTPTAPATTTPTVPTSPAPTTEQTPDTTSATPSKTPSLNELASLSQVAGQLSPLASGLSQAVTQGISSLSGAISAGVEDAVARLEDAIDPTKADERNPAGPPAAEFDIAGKHLKFEMADGELKLMLSDADGQPQEFSVRLDEHGMPVFSMNEPTEEPAPGGDPAQPGDQPQPDKSAPSGDKAQSEAPSTGQPSTGEPSTGAPRSDQPGPSGPEQEKSTEKAPAAEETVDRPGMPTGTPPNIRRGEDGEHRPKPMPGTQQPDTSHGPELAEAGPLSDLTEAGPL